MGVQRFPRSLVLVAFTLAWLPFVAKAVHVDDPLFLWAAEQIRLHPFDPYGFSVNWSGVVKPMAAVTRNPPLACYWLALAPGASEIALHLWMLPFALGAILGTYALARDLCPRPAEAALIAAFMPAFFVSSTTLMCDVPMVCAFVWAVVFWREDRPLLAALAAAAAALFKYFGIAVVPLLLADSLLRRKRPSAWLLLPVAVVAAWQWRTGLAVEAASYSLHFARASKLATAIVFAGGCFLPLLFHARWPAWIAAAAVLALWGQQGLLLFCGAGIVVFAARSEPLLALWIGGTIAFTGLLNWTVNARSLLPMAPALGILIARGGQRRWAIALGAACSLIVAWADYRLAGNAREAAQAVSAKWFEGHWGFQYYAQQRGLRPVEFDKTVLQPGDTLALPRNNTRVHPPPPGTWTPLETLQLPPLALAATMDPRAGAGFYSDEWGPLPFVFGRSTPEEVVVVSIVKPTPP